MYPMKSSLSTSSRVDVVSVMLPLPLATPYDYLVPGDMAVEIGSFVNVPLGQRKVTGVVWGKPRGGVEPGRLREIETLLDLPPMSEDAVEFVNWVANYTLSKSGRVLRMAMSAPEAFYPRKVSTAYKLAPGISGQSESLPPDLRVTDARKRILQVLARGNPISASALAKTAGTSSNVIRALVLAKVLETVSVEESISVLQPNPDLVRANLNRRQQTAAKKITETLDKGYSVSLIDGVTGSGKTEVYFEVIAAVLRSGKQAVVLLPEIALTSNWLDRFVASFGVLPVVWHSELRKSERRRNWLSVLEGKAKLVVGARSALMLPYRNLGLIVIDEEHDPSFKQEEGVIYNARDMAIVRGRIGGFPVVLSSATPSLETMDNVWRKRYHRVSLPQRYSGAQLPDISPIDMRKEVLDQQSWLSPALIDVVRNTLKTGEQVMLFLNRRGYAPLTLCRACGHRLGCPQCTAWLVEHRLRDRFQCHHCGYSTSMSKKCPVCQAENQFAACGPGVERLAEEVHQILPKARIEIMSSDTVRRAAEAQVLVRRMEAQEIDILIGTQIMAKGFHFPMLTLVGVVDADLGLAGGDLRAAERTYQLLQQVSGRAGRASRPGRVLVQTFQPEHPVMEAIVAGDRNQFMLAEAEARREHNMPPYGRLAAIIVSGPNEKAVDQTAKFLGRTAPGHDGINVFGPAPAPMSIVRGRYRYRLLVRAKKEFNIQNLLRRWIFTIKPVKGTRISIDVDPYNFI